MNNLFTLCSLCSLLFITGCSTTGGTGNNSLPAAIKVAAYVGTVEGLRSHPEWEPGFRLAAEELKVIETAEQIDFATVLAIVSSLPVKELRSDRAAIIITAATILLQNFGGHIDLQKAEQIRAVVKALREGIELGLPRRQSTLSNQAVPGLPLHPLTSPP